MNIILIALGMFFTLIPLSVIMFYTLWKEHLDKIVKPSWNDVAWFSIILSSGITMLYLGVLL